MENSKEKNGGAWLSVPQFGDWEQQVVIPDYSVDFSKIREIRKLNRRDTTRSSLGNEEDLIRTASKTVQQHHHHHPDNNSPTTTTTTTTGRRSVFRYFNCCIKA